MLNIKRKEKTPSQTKDVNYKGVDIGYSSWGTIEGSNQGQGSRNGGEETDLKDI